MIPFRCHRCGGIQLYHGKNTYRTTCRFCYATVYLAKTTITMDEYVDHLDAEHAKTRARLLGV